MLASRSLPLALIVVAVLAACSGPSHQTQDFAGTFTDSDGGMLTLHDGGSYELSGIPVGVLDNDNGAGSPETPNIAGTWDLVELETSAIMLWVDEGSDSYPYANIQLSIDSADRLYLFPDGVDSGPLHYLDRTSQP
jgi:hypothetical protein